MNEATSAEEAAARPQTEGPRTLAIDIGGSGTKALLLAPNGDALTKKVRQPTPEDSTPEAVVSVIRDLTTALGAFDRVSCGFPGVVVDGVVHTAPNLSQQWRGFPLQEALESLTGQPVRVANDADVQGLAVVEGRGLELVLTLGTGLGSALFVNGTLVPNLELGHHPFRKSKTYEDYLGAEGLARKGVKRWHKRLAEAIATLEALFSYRLLHLGGGNAKEINMELPDNVRIVPNIAGLLGGIKLWER